MAANNLDMEIDNLSPAKYDPEPPLTDYNEDDPIPALRRSASGEEAAFPDYRENKKSALKEKLAEKRICIKNNAYG